MSNPNLDTLLSRLDKLRQRGDGRWSACCPAHDDKGPSLSICETRDGRILLHCFAGCPVASVVAAVGITMGDLFPPDETGPQSPLRARERWVPRDVLLAVSHEALVTLVCARDMANGKTLTDAERDRLATAVDRINDALRQAGAQ